MARRIPVTGRRPHRPRGMWCPYQHASVAHGQPVTVPPPLPPGSGYTRHVWTPSVGSCVIPRPCHSREIFTRRGRGELEISVDPAPMRDDADGEKREKRRWRNVCVRGVMSSIDRRDQPANLPLCGPFQPLCDIVCSPPPRRQRELAELSSSSSSCHNGA